MLPKVYAEALVFGTDENGGDDVAGDEEEEKAVVQVRVVQGVVAREEDKPEGAGDCEEDWTKSNIVLALTTSRVGVPGVRLTREPAQHLFRHVQIPR